MFRNFDIKIKNTSIKDFLNRCNEMETEIMPALKAMGYVSNFQLQLREVWKKQLKGKNFYTRSPYILTVQYLSDDFSIPVDFMEKKGCLYLHDDYAVYKPFDLYNEKNSLFEVIRMVVETFPNAEYYETLSSKCSRYLNIFDYEKDRDAFLHSEDTKILSIFTKTNGYVLNEEKDEGEERE